jgi:hypothetical protein
LIHHLAIGNNLPFDALVDFFAQTGHYIIIEFVPKEDSQVIRLLEGRDDIFPDYNQIAFEASFGRCFDLVEKIPVEGSLRTMYLFQRRD